MTGPTASDICSSARSSGFGSLKEGTSAATLRGSTSIIGLDVKGCTFCNSTGTSSERAGTTGTASCTVC
ncbi:hypothetical protein HanPSC8_Chr10g0434181 [Helianthus annuus]|nr:hypothetical protein HanPSC8_Chr10g0434181 [Helianthus annuus]